MGEMMLQEFTALLKAVGAQSAVVFPNGAMQVVFRHHMLAFTCAEDLHWWIKSLSSHGGIEEPTSRGDAAPLSGTEPSKLTPTERDARMHPAPLQ